MRTSYLLLALVATLCAWMPAAAETQSTESQLANSLNTGLDFVTGVNPALLKVLRQHESALKERISNVEKEVKIAVADRAALIQRQEDLRAGLRMVQSAIDTDGHATQQQRDEYIARLQRTVAQIDATNRQYGEQLKEHDRKLAEQATQLAQQDTRVHALEDRADRQAAATTATQEQLNRQQIGMAELSRKVEALATAPKEPDVPSASRAGSFLTLGAMYGGVRTEIDGAVSTENRPVGLARLGYRFGPHFSVALEGSYWNSKTRKVNVPTGGQVTLNRALTEDGSAAALSLYFRLSDSVPVVLYGGVGGGWESHEIVQLGTSGSTIGKEISRQRVSGSGLAFIAGAGVELRTGPNSSLSLLARAVRSRMSSLSNNNPGDPDHQPERTVFSLGAALSFYP